MERSAVAPDEYAGARQHFSQLGKTGRFPGQLGCTLRRIDDLLGKLALARRGPVDDQRTGSDFLVERAGYLGVSLLLAWALPAKAQDQLSDCSDTAMRGSISVG